MLASLEHAIARRMSDKGLSSCTDARNSPQTAHGYNNGMNFPEINGKRHTLRRFTGTGAAVAPA